jgi:hypothetical protein
MEIEAIVGEAPTTVFSSVRLDALAAAISRSISALVRYSRVPYRRRRSAGWLRPALSRQARSP